MECFKMLNCTECLIRLTLAEVKKAAELSTCNKDEKIMMHCKAGVRSLITSSLLQKLGFKNVSTIDKGIDGLIAKKVNVVPLSKSPITSI